MLMCAGDKDSSSVSKLAGVIEPSQEVAGALQEAEGFTSPEVISADTPAVSEPLEVQCVRLKPDFLASQDSGPFEMQDVLLTPACLMCCY